MSEFQDRLTLLRRAFHKTPELGFALEQTKAHVAEWLSQLGIEVHTGAGVIGVLRVGEGNRAIGLRADMDALPISEKSTHGYTSEIAGRMHACGHDGHMAMLLGAAEILARSRDFNGTIVFLFQPNEELGLGAKAMIEEGILERFSIDEVYAIHNLPGAPLGEVSSRKGLICSSESLFEIEIKGQGGHASMPHVGAEAMIIGAEIVLALQTIVSRKLAPGSGAVVSVTEFLGDGQRNVLPGRVVIKGDARARSKEDRMAIKGHMRRLANGIGAAHGVEVETRFVTEFIETINADQPVDAVYRAAAASGLPLECEREPMSFSEDFAHFAAKVPGCFFLLGNGESGVHGQPLHSDRYDFNDALLEKGATLWANLARDRLGERKG